MGSLLSEALAKRLGPIARPKLDHPAWEYAVRYHLNNRNERLTFDGRQYLAELYQRLTPQRLAGRETVIEKSPQIGGSELLVCLILALSGELGWRVLYVLDRHTTRMRFVQDRVNKAILRVPYYRQLLLSAAGSADSLQTKDFGAGFLCFAGSNTEAEFIEMSADLVVVDEYDRCNLENVAMAQDRLMARESKKALLNISSPTHKGFGIDGLFEKSTRFRWHTTCPVCGKWQPLLWEKNVARWRENDWELRDREWTPDCGRDIRAFCRHCREGILDRSASGRWISEVRDAKRIGYHVPKLIDASVPLVKAWEDWTENAKESARKRELWFNRWLGVGYSESGARLTPEAVARAIQRDESGNGYLMPGGSRGPCVAGIDVGVELHVHITEETGHPSRTVFIGRIPTDFGEIARLLSRYHVRVAVFDADPEKKMIREWTDRLNRGGVKAWRCRYAEDDLGRLEPDYAEMLIRPDRTMSLDDSHEDITAEHPRIGFPLDILSLDGGKVVQQFCQPVRVIEERRGRMVAVWKKNPPEDYRHALNYSRLARGLFRQYGGGSGRIVGLGQTHYGGVERGPQDRPPSHAKIRSEMLRRRGVFGLRVRRPI